VLTGIEGAFDLEAEINEKVEIDHVGIMAVIAISGIDDTVAGSQVRTGYFAGDCFIYTNGSNRLNYYLGGQSMTLAHLGMAGNFTLVHMF